MGGRKALCRALRSVSRFVIQVSRVRHSCLAVIQKACTGDVRAFSKIVDIVGLDGANDELGTASADLVSADLDLMRRAFARMEAADSAATTADETKKGDKE